MSKKLLFLLVVSIVCCTMSMAEDIFLSRDKENTNIRILEDNLNVRGKASIVLTCHIQSMSATEIENEHGTFTMLSVPGWQYTYRAGEPQLPMLSKLVEVPLGGEVQVNLLSSQKIEADAKAYGIRHAIYPHQPSRRKDDKDLSFVQDRSAYQSSFSRAPIVQIEDAGVMRSRRLVLVHFLPIEYSPADGKIVIHNDIKAELIVNDADVAATMKVKEKYASSYFSFIAPRVLTPSSLAFRSTRAGEGYLIVADAMFEGNAKLEEFIAWKKKQYQVTVKYFSGATFDEVQKYIQSEYTRSAPTFLLIVGDHGQIPGKNCGQYTDLYYHSTLAGGSSDYKPDMLCGRFSANNAAELEAQINKTLYYEQKKYSADYLQNYALVAGWDSGWAVKRGYPQIRYAFENYFKEDNGFVAPLESGSGRNVFLTTGSGQAEKDIVALVNKGVGFFNYTAHGSQTEFCDPEFTFSDIDSLNNYGKYPLVVGNCCLTGSFQVTTCFGEKWLRAADKGAIGFIGGSNYTYWDEDLWFGVGCCTLTTEINGGKAPKKEDTQVGMYEVGFGEYGNLEFQISCNAAVMYAGNMAVEISPSTRKKYYFEVYHLFGDPSLPTSWSLK